VNPYGIELHTRSRRLYTADRLGFVCGGVSVSTQSWSAAWDYLDVVLGIARENPAGLFDRYGPDPRRTIMKDLQQILDVKRARR